MLPLGRRLKGAVEAKACLGFDRFTQRLTDLLLRSAFDGAPYVSLGFETQAPELHRKLLLSWLLSQEVDASNITTFDYGLQGKALAVFLHADPQPRVTVTRVIRRGWEVLKLEKLDG